MKSERLGLSTIALNAPVLDAVTVVVVVKAEFRAPFGSVWIVTFLPNRAEPTRPVSLTVLRLTSA